MAKELIIDSFAGGGGASTGIEWATGRSPDIAINHDEMALEMHAANHPETLHVREDVWKAKLKKLVGRRKVGLLWLSPDCKHFSVAKGSKPVEKNIRSLAWVACKWAEQIKPRIICLENVREFAMWGPLVPVCKCDECDWKGTEGQATLVRTRRKCPRCESRKLKQTTEMIPCPDRKGLTFKRFIGRLRNLGYVVEWKNLDAADYGACTHRKRLFLIARRDGLPITWPEPTHCDPKNIDSMPLFDRLQPYGTAAECIDWSIPCPSIFDRKKPLAEKTLRRIAMGIRRFVLDNPKPYIVRIGHTHGDGNYTYDASKPLTTVTTKAEHLLVTPTLVQVAHGDSGGTREHSVDQPIGTVTQTNNHAWAVAHLVRHHGGDGTEGRAIDRPAPTAVGRETANQLCSVYIAKHFGGMVGVSPETPLPTTTSKGCQNQIVSATLVQTGYGERAGQNPRALDPMKPLGTVVAGGIKHAIAAAHLHRANFDDAGSDVNKPLPTTTCNNHSGLVYAFLTKYFGTAVGSNLLEPHPTNTTKERTGLVTVTLAGEPYVIVDIGMRMLTPRELATAQGFPSDYILTGTKTSQVARIGNSVVPHVAKAIVEANYVKAVATV